MIEKGVVEDVNDPLELGRVRVRIFGLHTDDKSLIKTEDLPWAQTMQSVSSASMSGIGSSPTGLLPGSWVVVFFLDPEKQYPFVLGSFAGIPVDNRFKNTSLSEIEFSDNSSIPTNAVLDSNGTPVETSSGVLVTDSEKPQIPEEEKVIPGKVDPSKLGSVSSKYESSGDPGAINNYKSGEDSGGASYGAYQFASYAIGKNTPSKNRTLKNIYNSSLMKYLKRSNYSNEFSGLYPATPEFDLKWKEISKRESIKFLADQHQEIQRQYYQILANKLNSDTTNRGVAVHEAMWSRSVQLGSPLDSKLFNSIGNIDRNLCDSKFVEILYNKQIDLIPTYFTSSPKLWSSLKNRFISERDQLIKLAKTYEGDCTDSVLISEETQVQYDGLNKTKTVTTKTTIDPKSVNPKDLSVLGERGFTDPSKKYPLYFNEADTNRLARGIISGTEIAKKRASVITQRNAGNNLISEPTTQYNAKYPKNKVFKTESGHVIELDDTDGYERIHVYHRSGSFVEFHPDGKIVTKAVGSNHTIVSENNEIIVLGDQNTSISGSENKTVDGEQIINISEDKTENINGSLTIKVLGDVNINSSGNISLNAENGELNFNATKYNFK